MVLNFFVSSLLNRHMKEILHYQHKNYIKTEVNLYPYNPNLFSFPLTSEIVCKYFIGVSFRLIFVLFTYLTSDGYQIYNCS